MRAVLQPGGADPRLSPEPPGQHRRRAVRGDPHRQRLERRHRQPGPGRGPPVPCRAQRGEHRLRPRLQPGGGIGRRRVRPLPQQRHDPASGLVGAARGRPRRGRRCWARSSPSSSIPTDASTTPAASSSVAASRGSTARAAPSRTPRNSRAAERPTTPRGHVSSSVTPPSTTWAASTTASLPPTTRTPTCRSLCAPRGGRCCSSRRRRSSTSKGATAGTDVGQGIKRYQIRNAVRFTQKWAQELAQRPPLRPDEVERWAHRPQGGFGPGETLPRPGRHRCGRRSRRGVHSTVDPRPRSLHAGVRPGLGGTSDPHHVALSFARRVTP